jgi:hypothetical protein
MLTGRFGRINAEQFLACGKTSAYARHEIPDDQVADLAAAFTPYLTAAISHFSDGQMTLLVPV